MSSSRRTSLQVNNSHGVPLRRSPRRLRTKTPSLNELSKKFKVSPKGKRRLEFKPQKPLKGKRFYLDLQSFRRRGLLISRIEALGGNVDEFLSKDLSYVITNRKDVDTQCATHSPSTPSPGMSVPSPVPGTKSSSMKGPSPLSVDSPNSTEPKHDTRGRAIAKKATSMHRIGTSDVLTNARTWGVQVIQLERFVDKLEQYGGKERERSKQVAVNGQAFKVSSKPRVRKLNAPFIKVEDHSRHFKPLVHELKEWPRIYFDTPVGTCPFDPPKRGQQDSQVKQRSHKKKGREEKQQKRGYCECCCSHYKDLDLHLRSDHHQNFARNDSNYVNLDALISRGPSLKDFLDKVREKHREKAAQRQEHEREENFDVNSQQQTPAEAASSGERRNELLNETTPVQTPQGSELGSDESLTRVTRSRSKSQKCDETPPGREQAGGLQVQSECLPLEKTKTADNAADSFKDPSVSTEGPDTRESKPGDDEESPTIRITRSAKVRSNSVSPQKTVLGVRSNQNADSKDDQQSRKSFKKGTKASDQALMHDDKSSTASKGDYLRDGTASDHMAGDFDKIGKEPGPVEVARMTRSKKNSPPSVKSNSPSEHDSSNENAEVSGSQSRNDFPEEAHHEKRRLAIKIGDNKLSPECDLSEPSSVNPAVECCNDTQDFESFTKITRAKAKALSKEKVKELSARDTNATQYHSTKGESSNSTSREITQQNDVTSSATSIVVKTRSSPRLMVSATVTSTKETKDAEEDDSDKTESIELSQEPPNPIKTQSMQVMLRDTLSGTSSSTVTIISSCSEPARNKEPQSDSTDDESTEAPRTYPLRNRSGLEQTTKKQETRSQPRTRATASSAVREKEDAAFHRETTTVSAISAKLRGRKVPGASVCRAARITKHNRDEISRKKEEPLSSANSPQSDCSSRGETASGFCSDQSSSSCSSPRSGPTPTRDDKVKSNVGAKRVIFSDDSEDKFSDEETPVKKGGNAKRRRKIRVILSDVSDSDSVNDSLIAHHGTPQDRRVSAAAQESLEITGGTSSQNVAPPSVAAKSKDAHNKQDEEWNLGDKLSVSASKFETTKERSLSQLFESDEEEEEFHGFDVPHFDQSMSSERDLSFRIESIVENMTEKEDVPLDPLKPMSFKETCRQYDEIESTRTLSPDGRKRSRKNEEKSLQDEEKCSSRCNGKYTDTPTQSNVSNFERDQETGKCLNRDILDYVTKFGQNDLETSREEGKNEVDVCENGDSSSTVADSTDGEDDEATGLTPRIELKFRRRKREVDVEYDDDMEIGLPAKRSRSQSETSVQSSPAVETRSAKSRQPSQVKRSLLEAQEHIPAQETCKEFEVGNGESETTVAAADSGPPHEDQPIQQDVVFSKQEEFNIMEEKIFHFTLEERVKLRRSKGKGGAAPHAERSSPSKSRETVPAQGGKTGGKDTRKVELRKKPREGKEVGESGGKRRVAQELEQNTKKMMPESEEGRRSRRKTPKAGVGKNAKTEWVAKQSVTKRMPVSTDEVGIERRRAASANTVTEPHAKKANTGNERSAVREADDDSKMVALRPLRPLKSRFESTAKQARGVSKELKPLKPLKPSNSISPPSSLSQSSNSSPCHATESSSSCDTPSARLCSSASRIFKQATFSSSSVTPANGKKTRRAFSTPAAGPLLVTPHKRSHRFLRVGDQYEFVDESVDVYDFNG